jgi:hypothetical protein
VDFKNSETLSDWGKWKSTLAKAVNIGEAVGLEENTIDKMAYKVGNMLSAAVDPENREERVLQELWKAGDDGDRKVLAKLVVNMTRVDDK